LVELRASTPRRIGRAIIAVLLAALGAAGCHDHSALEKQIADLRKELSAIHTVQGNNGIMLEDLDNRLLLLHDQVDSNRLMLGSVGPPPALPVVRLRPLSPIYPAEVVRATEAPVVSYAPHAATEPTPAPSPVPEPAPGGTIRLVELNEHGEVVTSGDGASDLAAARETTPPARTPTVARAASTKTGTASTKTADARALGLYKSGMALLKQKRHRDAVAIFEDFLSQFPRHPYADNCTYWIGEAFYDRQMFHKALAHFEQVVVQYPRGNKVPDAILKAAFCYSSLGLRDRAAELFDKLIRAYPGTPAARLAEKRKAELL